jgi:hypothetical protein
MTKKQAYKIVIKDLRRGTKCKDYAFGCYQCMTQRLVQDLKDVYELEFGKWTKIK